MGRETATTEISAAPDLAQLAHEVALTGKRLTLTENGAAIAVISPAHRRGRKGKPPKAEAIEAALAAAGGWKDLLDPEEFARQRRELQVHDRPPRVG